MMGDSQLPALQVSELNSTISNCYSVQMTAMTGEQIDVPVTGTPGADYEIKMVLEATIFKDWVAAVEEDERLFVTAIHIESVDFFGPRVGFVKLTSTAKLVVGSSRDQDESVIDIPGIVFMRGGAVGVLVILECEGREHTIVTYQARVPVGSSAVAEIPAGMLDGRGDFKGVAAQEIKEECGMTIRETDLIDMTSMVYGDSKGMLPSAGGCDEFIKLYVYRRSVEPEYLADLEGRLTGVRSEGERITLHIVPLDNLWRVTSDAKALSALTLYRNLKESGELPDTIGVSTPSTRSSAKQLELPSAVEIDSEEEFEELIAAAERRHEGRLAASQTAGFATKIVLDLQRELARLEAQKQKVARRLGRASRTSSLDCEQMNDALSDAPNASGSGSFSAEEMNKALSNLEMDAVPTAAVAGATADNCSADKQARKKLEKIRPTRGLGRASRTSSLDSEQMNDALSDASDASGSGSFSAEEMNKALSKLDMDAVPTAAVAGATSTADNCSADKKGGKKKRLQNRLRAVSTSQ